MWTLSSTRPDQLFIDDFSGLHKMSDININNSLMDVLNNVGIFPCMVHCRLINGGGMHHHDQIQPHLNLLGKDDNDIYKNKQYSNQT